MGGYKEYCWCSIKRNPQNKPLSVFSTAVNTIYRYQKFYLPFDSFFFRSFVWTSTLPSTVSFHFPDIWSFDTVHHTTRMRPGYTYIGRRRIISFFLELGNTYIRRNCCLRHTSIQQKNLFYFFEIYNHPHMRYETIFFASSSSSLNLCISLGLFFWYIKKHPNTEPCKHIELKSKKFFFPLHIFVILDGNTEMLRFREQERIAWNYVFRVGWLASKMNT